MRKQCGRCPWKRSTDPRTIPNGYDPAAHRALGERTIARGEPLEQVRQGTLRVMACHETSVGRERPCIGWLANQLGDGNNILLRMAVVSGRIDGAFELDGEQWETFEQTLPEGGDHGRG